MGFVFTCCVMGSGRGAIREAHQIEGGCCGDCCVSLFCGWCVLAQMNTQIGGGAGTEMAQGRAFGSAEPPVPMNEMKD